MNKLFVTTLVSALVVTASVMGYWFGGGFEKVFMPKNRQMDKKPSYWVAPMDPTYRRDQPGKSPMGMDLLPVYGAVAGEVRISPIVEHNLGVRTQQAVLGPMAQHIDTVGYIRLDEERLSHIHTRVEGWIESLAVSSVGDAVAQGDVLFELYSPALVNAQEEYLLALRSKNTVLVGASQQRLVSLGLTKSLIASLRSTRKVSQRVAFLAPSDGILTSLNVREGMFVNPSLEVMAIGQLDSVWVIAEVFERQAGWLATGQKATMSVESYPGDVWSGEVEYIYPELNEMTRTSQLRIRVDNSNRRLKPNMYAQLRIEAGNDQPRVSVPMSAVIRGAELEGTFKDRVVMRIAEGAYRTVPVKTGIESAGRIEILGGLKDSDTVVVSGQFLIDSESNIDAEIQRMSGSAND
ncbi:MAG: efflux RND transporter periplasmic adaptor subunit [Porticoccus sp.]